MLFWCIVRVERVNTLPSNTGYRLWQVITRVITITISIPYYNFENPGIHNVYRSDKQSSGNNVYVHLRPAVDQLHLAPVREDCTALYIIDWY